MGLKRALIFTYGNDDVCTETKKFIEDAGVLLQIRDIEKDPLSVNELSDLIGHIDITHFLNTFSNSYTKHRLDKNLPPRDKIYELMSKDHTLIRHPIVKSTRLMTVGCNLKKIAEMLQINFNGNNTQTENVKSNIKSHPKNFGKTNSTKHSQSRSASSK